MIKLFQFFASFLQENEVCHVGRGDVQKYKKGGGEMKNVKEK